MSRCYVSASTYILGVNPELLHVPEKIIRLAKESLLAYGPKGWRQTQEAACIIVEAPNSINGETTVGDYLVKTFLVWRILSLLFGQG